VYFSAKSWFLKHTGFLHGNKMKRDKFICPASIGITIFRSSNAQPNHYTDYGIWALS